MLNLIPNYIKNNKHLKLTFNNNYKIKSYFYVTNFARDEENLCKMEIKYLFNKIPDKKYFFSNHYINPFRSPFIKQCISIIYTGNRLQDILDQINSNKLSCENFKVKYINVDEESIGFHKRRKIEFDIGMNINGEAEMHNPEICFGITKVNDKWIFGKCISTKLSWKIHNLKPYYYSNALDVKTARAVVNIAIGNNLNCKVVDPCCGIGTVVTEALHMGVNIKGYEINPLIAENAKKNLKYFDYDDVITNMDMHNIEDCFDVSILDIPYGLFSLTTLKEQLAIIKTARKISKKSIIITFENMDEHVTACGFKIIDKCWIAKGKFKRYIAVCI